MNQIDKNIKEKLANRTFTPSASAWERLEVQLNTNPQQKKKKGWLFFAAVAASIAILFSIAISFFSNINELVKPNEIIVNKSIDTLNIKQNINKIFNDVEVEEAFVTNEIMEKDILIPTVSTQEKIEDNQYKKLNSLQNEIVKKKAHENLVKEKNKIVPKEKQKKSTQNTIQINSNDLLYAVTHSQIEVNKYYTKHQISREDVLNTIKGELKKSDININPETILAEVERSIGDEDFQNNFMKSLKKRVSNIATAFASRNN